ncbi:Importin-11, partial [Cucurbita argyrosperma subsp. argyrosperma]
MTRVLFVHVLVKLTLLHTLILELRILWTSATDLEEWYQNPESFHHEQDMVLWTEKLRPCAEALYIVLFENHSQLLGPVVVSILREAMNGCSSSVTDISPGLLLKDAAYGAAAYASTKYKYNYIAFDEVPTNGHHKEDYKGNFLYKYSLIPRFNGALSLEISNDHPNMRIIRRKVALILGQWVSEVKDDTKRQVYCALIRLLQDKDLSVQVQVLNLISVLIDRVSEVIPYSNVLISFFQKVWEESSGESLLQIQLLIALRNLVVALGYQSPVCYNMLMPILDRSIDVNHPDEINLLEDSLLLWEATVSHAPSLVPSLLTYFPRLVDIMERSFDHLEVAINIIETYILLGGNEFISMLASSIARILDLIIGNVNDRGLLSTLPIIDLLVQCFPAVVPPMIGSTLQKLIVICLSGKDERDPSKTSVKASSAAILARVLVMNTNYLAQLMTEPSLTVLLQKEGIQTEENILLSLVDLWLDKVDNVSSIQKKMYGLALSIILTLRLPQVLDKLDQILSVCTTVILGGTDDQTEESRWFRRFLDVQTLATIYLQGEGRSNAMHEVFTEGKWKPETSEETFKALINEYYTIFDEGDLNLQVRKRTEIS